MQQCADLLDGWPRGGAMQINGKQHNQEKRQKKNSLSDLYYHDRSLFFVYVSIFLLCSSRFDILVSNIDYLFLSEWNIYLIKLNTIV